MTRTTMSSTARGLARMPYLTPRELDGVLDDIDAGELIPIMDEDTDTIAALAIEEVADRLATTNADLIRDLLSELTTAQRELRALVTIVGEVFAESEPSGHRWKIEEAADDVTAALDSAIYIAEEAK